MKIFLIHARRTAYGVIRSLCRQPNAEFYLADQSKTPIFSSKYVRESFLVSDITSVSDEEFLDEMIELARKMDYQSQKPIVFTGKDDYLLFFARHSAQLSEYYDFSFESNYDRLCQVLDKGRLHEAAARVGVNVPKTFSQEHDLDYIEANARLPLVVKPAVKNTPEIDVVKAAFRINICKTYCELRQSVTQLANLNVAYIVQEFIPGGDDSLVTVGVYSQKGELKAWSTSRKLRQFPPLLGECSYGTTFYDDRLVQDVTRLLAATQLSGISQVEFKQYDGNYYLIEINPRIWSWHQIHTKVGVNLPLIAVNNIRGPGISALIEPYRGRKGIKRWMFFWMDYAYNYKLNSNISLIGLLRSVLTTNVEAFFCLTDMAPFIVHTRETISYIRTLVRQRSTGETDHQPS